MSTQKLPPFTPEQFTFIVASTVTEADAHIQTLMNSNANSDNVFGFNVELTPTKAVCLIQITSCKQAVVLDIALIGLFPTSLLEFVANANYIKIGVDILGDARTLPDITMCSGGELSHLHCMIDHSGAELGLPFSSSIALASLSEHWLGKTLDKTLQKYDWSQALQTTHYVYAAADAAAAIRIYDTILKRHPSVAALNAQWIFQNIDPLNEKAVSLCDDYTPYSAKSLAPIKSIEGCLKKMQRAIIIANATNQHVSCRIWSEMETPAMVTFCAQLTHALDNYYAALNAESM
ncbi:ribonuclease H-like protein [Pleurotus eryngii]|uniref:Ribonuclease H-like protein n=1 Tax=Pleurotus eryngii TaxID=5323 RepID=A0A9P5ZSN6_PLEER|nr:ribonuclease H-like protein [Pleurotus eryngii]